MSGHWHDIESRHVSHVTPAKFGSLERKLTVYSHMVGLAKSQALKNQILRKEVDDLKAHAVALYTAEEQRALAPGEKKQSLRQICKDASDAHFAETGRRIPLAHNTLARHAKGGVTLTQSNQAKSWLTAEEEESIINFTIEVAQRGFPLSPRRLKEHCEAVLQYRLGKNFPEEGLGRDWGNRFITKHHNRLGMYWSNALDSSRGRAVNPVTKEEYFRLLKDVREEYNIPDELVYGADETGIQSGIGIAERVIGPARIKIQHQQRSGTRENITVLPTICADGTSLAPTVIYKGEAFQTKWLQENPLDARYYSHFKTVLQADLSVGWDTRRRATHRGRLVLPGSKTGINRQRPKPGHRRDCFSLMATAHITPSGSWSMPETTTLLCYVTPPIQLTSIKGLMLLSSVS